MKSVLYLKLKLLSNYRLFRGLPLFVQCLVFVLFLFFGYVLVISEISVSPTNFLYCFIIFLFIGRWVSMLSDKETLLIKSLKIPIAPILLLKCFFLGLLFYILNPLMGVIVLTIGSFTVYFLDRYKINFLRFTIPSFFLPQAYQWLSTWRSASVYVYLLGILIMVMGLHSGNDNLVNVMIITTICIPCLIAYFQDVDPRFFLMVYKSPSRLIYSKTKELLINSLLLAIVPVILILIFNPLNSYPYLWIIGGIFGNCFMLFAYYCCYPNIIQASIILCFVLFLVISAHILMGIYAPIINIVLLFILYNLAYSNLKSIIYVNITSGDRTTKI